MYKIVVDHEGDTTEQLKTNQIAAYELYYNQCRHHAECCAHLGGKYVISLWENDTCLKQLCLAGEQLKMKVCG